MYQLELFPTVVASVSRFEIEDVKLLTTDIGSCSSAFIQFANDCPHWVARDVSKHMDKKYFKLMTAKVVDC